MPHDGVRPRGAEPLALCAPERELEGEEAAEGAVAARADDRSGDGEGGAEQEGRRDAGVRGGW